MSEQVWVVLSARSGAEDGAGVEEAVSAVLRDEGIEFDFCDPSGAVRQHAGVDGRPWTMAASSRPLLIRGDVEAFGERMAATLARELAELGPGGSSAVTLRHAEDGPVPEYFPTGSDEDRKLHTRMVHALDGALTNQIEDLRDHMSRELLPALVRHYPTLKTWEQRAAFMHLCMGHESTPELSHICHDLLVSEIRTPWFQTGIFLALAGAAWGLLERAGYPCDYFQSEEWEQLDRLRKHLRLGGELPMKPWELKGDSQSAYIDAEQLLGDSTPLARTQELLEAILAAPLEDEPRRALADAIRQKNPTRARMIDLGLAIAVHRRQGRQEPAELRDEHSALSRAHGDSWAGPLGQRAQHVLFRRGFVEEVWLEASQLHRGESVSAIDCFEDYPVLDLHVQGVQGRIGELLHHGALRKLRTLRLKSQGLTDADAAELASCESLRGLKGLDLSCNRLTLQGLFTIARAFKELRWLDAEGNSFGELMPPEDAPEAGLSDVARELLDRLGPLPWLTDPVRSASGSLPPLPEQL